MPTTSFKNLLRFLLFLKPYWKKGLLAFVFMLLSVSLQLPMPFLTRYLIDKVIILKSFRLLNLIGLVLVGVLLVRAGSSFLQSFLLTTFRGRVLFDIRLKLFEHIQKASICFFHQKQTGYLMSRLSDDVNAVQGLLAETLVSAGQNILTFIAGIICTVYIHPKLALICFLVLPLYLLSLVVFNKRVRNLSRETREKFALVQKDLQELLSGVSVIKAFTGEGRATLRLLSGVKEAIRTEIKLDITATVASISSVLISSIGPLVLIWYGCGEIMRGNLTVGGLLAFNSFIAYLFGPVRTLYDLNLGVQRSLAAVERIFEILEVETEKDDGKDIKISQGRVMFDRVSFSYDGTNTVLKDISFEIEPGKTVALVGRSGVGKTTLVSLLLKFYQPESGWILIDGQNLAWVKAKSLRKQIGLVSQEIFLFSDTIKENIRFGSPNASDDEIITAAKLAHAHDFIEDLTEGYETKIGERGCTLSGGQRQRIAIARAILKNPRILILDEATSQVDTESERLIQEALREELLKDRTTLVIAHRLSTVQQADKIVVLDEGRIVEQGTHQELYEKGGIYRELYEQLGASY
ncbi:MAG: ABC transporter ATP-binding protein [Candidatus Edwardsbacteria bacterium]